MTECEWCGDPIEPTTGPGRPAKYCCRAHRQRAYEQRRAFYNRSTLIEMARLLGMECYICDDTLTLDSLQFDHVIPLVLGGPDEPENIRPVCLTCNAEKGASQKFVPIS